MRPTLLFDYGGTLDSRARHWNYILLDGFRHAAQTLEPALAVVEGQLWRDAYVHGERTLAQESIIRPEDDFGTLLLKKTRIEMAYLAERHHLSLSPTRIEECAQAVANYCDGEARRCAAESRDVLATLRQRGYSFVMVSNFYGNLRSVLRAYGLLDFFPTIVESAVVGVRKPDPAIWQLGVEAAGVEAQRCIAIGDSYGKDIAAANAVGCKTVWFEGEEWESKARDRSLPTHIIAQLAELLQLLP